MTQVRQGLFLSPHPLYETLSLNYSADLKSFFAEVVKTKNKLESPRSRPRSQSDKPRKNFSPLEQHGRELGEL